MRTLLLNTPELRSGLAKAFKVSGYLTEDEWRALKGARRQLEAAAARQRRDWLRDALGASGLPRPLQWVIEKRLKSREFTSEELEAEIQVACEKSVAVED